MAYSPTLGGTNTATAFPLQFPDARISDLSLSTTIIHQLSNDGKETIVSHGTGFFWRHNGTVFLITARHVLSGRDPFDDAPMSPMGYIPTTFRVFPTAELLPDTWRRVMVQFEIDQSNETPFLQDPKFNELRTDIAAKSIAFSPDIDVKCINDAPDIFEPVMSHVGFECSILGYPQTNLGGLMTPIWRRGTFASEPLLPVDEKPMFLLDAATSPGFSGAPVFRRHIGPAPIQQPDGTINVLADRVVTTSFVGVYAGRLRHVHVGGEVPFVFYGNRIPFILSGSIAP